MSDQPQTLDAPNEPGAWTTEHENTGSRRWDAIVTYGADKTLQAMMACNIREYPVEELIANGWRNWQSAAESAVNEHCPMCDGWGFIDRNGNIADISLCLECDGPTRQS